MKTWALICVALSGACTSFVKVDDAGPGDAGLDVVVLEDTSAPVDGQTDAEGDAQTDAEPLPDAALPCMDLEYTGTLDPEFQSAAVGEAYTLRIPFAQLRARLFRVDARGMPCGAEPSNPDGSIRRLEDSSFVPVHGASLDFGEFSVGIQISGPEFTTATVTGTVNSRFGASLSAENNRVAVGAPDDRYPQTGVNAEPIGPLGDMSTGAVYLFDVTNAGTTEVPNRDFELLNFFKATDPFSGRFGEHADLGDGHLVVSEPNYVSDGEFGRIHVFRAAPWEALGVIPRPSSFGRVEHVRTQDGHVLVGVPRAGTGPYSGQVQIFEASGDPVAQIAQSATDDQFGSQFEVAGDVMLVQQLTPNILHVYRRIDGSWVGESTLVLTVPAPLFATDGTHALVVEAVQSELDSSWASTVSLYTLARNSFDLIETFTVADRARSVAIRYARFAVGFPNMDAAGEGRVLTGHLTWDGSLGVGQSEVLGTVGGQFGGSVAFTESAGLVVGAPLQGAAGGVFLYQ